MEKEASRVEKSHFRVKTSHFKLEHTRVVVRNRNKQEINNHVWLWLRVSMPKENDLLSRCCHVSSIVGKCTLFCAFSNDDSSPKHSWFSFNSQAHARLANFCRKSRQNYFQTDVFLFSKDPHIWRFVWNHNSQKNKEYILNRYHNRSSEPCQVAMSCSVEFRSMK